MIIIDKSNSKKLENLSAEELKKRILLTENKIAKAKKGEKEKTSKKEPTPKVKQPFKLTDIDFGAINLDKITKIDDILKEFFEQQKLTNILLSQLVRMSEVTPQLISTGGIGRPEYSTNVKQWDTLKITDNLSLINENGSGSVSELVLISDSTVAANKVYSLQIIADGKTIWNDTWTNFEIKSPYFSEMTAFDDDTYFVLAFQSIPFNESIVVNINEAPNVEFASIFIKVIKKVGQLG